jgi:hypothetical protein
MKKIHVILIMIMLILLGIVFIPNSNAYIIQQNNYNITGEIYTATGSTLTENHPVAASSTTDSIRYFSVNNIDINNFPSYIEINGAGLTSSATESKIYDNIVIRNSANTITYGYGKLELIKEGSAWRLKLRFYNFSTNLTGTQTFLLTNSAFTPINSTSQYQTDMGNPQCTFGTASATSGFGGGATIRCSFSRYYNGYYYATYGSGTIVSLFNKKFVNKYIVMRYDYNADQNDNDWLEFFVDRNNIIGENITCSSKISITDISNNVIIHQETVNSTNDLFTSYKKVTPNCIIRINITEYSTVVTGITHTDYISINSTSSSNNTKYYHGHVLNEDNSFVGNVKVSFSNLTSEISVYTDTNGYYILAIPYNNFSSYTLKANKTGYIDTSITVNPISDFISNIYNEKNFQIFKGSGNASLSTINVYCKETGLAIYGVKVTFTNATGYKYYAYTDGFGKATYNLPLGIYTVTTDHQNYYSSSNVVDASISNTYNLNLNLINRNNPLPSITPSGNPTPTPSGYPTPTPTPYPDNVFGIGYKMFDSLGIPTEFQGLILSLVVIIGCMAVGSFTTKTNDNPLGSQIVIAVCGVAGFILCIAFGFLGLEYLIVAILLVCAYIAYKFWGKGG